MIGWIQLSREAVASAERALDGSQQSVRDEIGFLGLHQALADRFFPGTSVLHTRLRYVLFVPWLLQRSAGNAKRFHEESLKLTRQLAESNEHGVIGARNLLREPAQTAAMIYWSALARWGILRPRPDRAVPTRKQVLQRIAAEHAHSSTDRMIDGELAWSPDHTPFVDLPPAPSALLQAGHAIDFKLARRERTFLRRQLMAVCREDGKQSLLARVAETRVPVEHIQHCWHQAVLRVADAEDKHHLKLAKHAASLAGIGRAVYAALVEQARNDDDSGNRTACRKDLERMRQEHGNIALDLDLSALRTALPMLDSTLLRVLTETQEWLRSARSDISQLSAAYAKAERERKRLRARLGTHDAARTRREEWDNPGATHPTAEPLHYRWFRVRGLLADLLGSDAV